MRHPKFPGRLVTGDRQGLYFRIFAHYTISLRFAIPPGIVVIVRVIWLIVISVITHPQMSSDEEDRTGGCVTQEDHVELLNFEFNQ